MFVLVFYQCRYIVSMVNIFLDKHWGPGIQRLHWLWHRWRRSVSDKTRHAGVVDKPYHTKPSRWNISYHELRLKKWEYKKLSPIKHIEYNFKYGCIFREQNTLGWTYGFKNITPDATYALFILSQFLCCHLDVVKLLWSSSLVLNWEIIIIHPNICMNCAILVRGKDTV